MALEEAKKCLLVVSRIHMGSTSKGIHTKRFKQKFTKSLNAIFLILLSLPEPL